jgi:Ammonium Transporter Family
LARAGAGLVNPWAAAVIGAVGGIFYVLTSELMLKHKLDDVVNAVAMHLAPGVWGVISIGFFARPSNVANAYSIPECATASTCAALLCVHFSEHTACEEIRSAAQQRLQYPRVRPRALRRGVHARAPRVSPSPSPALALPLARPDVPLHWRPGPARRCTRGRESVAVACAADDVLLSRGCAAGPLLATHVTTRSLCRRGVKFDCGIIYGGNGKQLGVQLLGIASLLAWVFVTITPLFLILRWADLLRVPAEVQLSVHVRTLHSRVSRHARVPVLAYRRLCMGV